MGLAKVRSFRGHDQSSGWWLIPGGEVVALGTLNLSRVVLLERHFAWNSLVLSHYAFVHTLPESPEGSSALVKLCGFPLSRVLNEIPSWQHVAVLSS